MKKTKKLNLSKETVRTLSVDTLVGVVGGLSANACSFGQTGCGVCGPQRPTLRFTNCNACVTDICGIA